MGCSFIEERSSAVSDAMGGAGEDEVIVAQLPADEVHSVLRSDRPFSSRVTLVRALNLLELQFPYLQSVDNTSTHSWGLLIVQIK